MGPSWLRQDLPPIRGEEAIVRRLVVVSSIEASSRRDLPSAQQYVTAAGGGRRGLNGNQLGRHAPSAYRRK